MNDRPCNESDEALLARLKASLEDAPLQPIDPGFKPGVMAEIRAHALSPGKGRRLVLQRAIRNGALAAAAVALLCAGISLFGGHGLALDVTRLVALEPDALLQLVWFY